MEHEEAVILVVGGPREKESKALVADLLAEGRGASNARMTASGARTFSIESSTGPLVVDTTALSPVDTSTGLLCFGRFVSVQSDVIGADRWISTNSLKRMYDKFISVVCVVNSSGIPDATQEDYNGYLSRWLTLLAFIFHEHRQEIMVLVQVVGRDDKAQIATSLVQHGFPEKNMSFVTFTREHLRPTIKSALETSVKGERGKGKTASVGPFRVRKITSKCKRLDFHGPWGPSPVILFGRTGSGKSTLAQMLTKGRLDSHCKDFTASSGIRGETTKLTAGEGRGWYVVDTPGFGEPDIKEATVSSEEAEKKLKRYVQQIQGDYQHFLYVRMKDRTDELEVQLWNFFVSLFSEAISTHFTVVVSNADQTWIKKNEGDLRSTYKGCNSFVSVEFPPNEIDDKEWEIELEEVRKESLSEIEEALISLSRFGAFVSQFGKFARKSEEKAVAGLRWATLDDDDVRSGGKLTDKTSKRSLAEAVKDNYLVKRLLLTLKKDEKLLLLPQY